MKVKTFYELEVWQLAIDLAERIYKFCKFLPTEERFVLCDQMRRSSSSIAFNIAEGQKRFSTKDFIRFLSIARGSLGELLTQLILCNRIGYLPEEDFLRAKKRCEIIDIKLYNLAKSLSHKTDRNKIISATNKKSQKNNKSSKKLKIMEKLKKTNTTVTASHNDNVSQPKSSTL